MFLKHYRVKFKEFCFLPMNTPMHTLNLLLGDTKEIIKSTLEKSYKKLKNRYKDMTEESNIKMK